MLHVERQSKLIVTGVGRSGTGWITGILNALDVPSTHEHSYSPFRQDPTLGQSLIEVSWLAAPYLHDLPQGTSIAVMLRHPDQVVRSFTRLGFFADKPDSFPFHTGRRICSKLSPSVGRLFPPVRYDYVSFLEKNQMWDPELDPVSAAYSHWLNWMNLIESRGEVSRILSLDDVTAQEIGGLLSLVDVDASIQDIEVVLGDRSINRNEKQRISSTVDYELTDLGEYLRQSCLEEYARWKNKKEELKIGPHSESEAE